MVDELAFELRKSRKLTSCITIKIRYADFNTYTKQKRIAYTASDNILLSHATEIFNRLYERRQLIRLVGVKFSGLVNGNYQISLFDDDINSIRLLQEKDWIRKRFGADKIKRAIYM